MPALSVTQSRTKWFLLGICVIALVTTFAYWPALNGGFLLDDDLLLTENPLVKAPGGLPRIWFTTEAVDYWPVANTSFWIGWRLWGMDPTGYHVVNLFLHIANALLIWLILRKLAIPGAFFAALLFAIHPVNVESVAWISQRKGLLAMLFFLLAIVCYLRVEEIWILKEKEPTNRSAIGKTILHAGRWYWLSLVAFLLAMLSKGSVAILPLILLLIVWWRRRRLTVKDLPRTAPFWAIAIVLTGVNIWCQSRLSVEPFRTATFADRIAGAAAVVWFYLSKALLPLHLQVIYPQWQIHTGHWVWWAPTAAALLLTVILLWRRKTSWGRPLLFAWVFCCVALVPVMGLTDISYMKYSLVADHYQYIAIIAILALIAAVWSYCHWHLHGAFRSATTVCAIALVSALTFLTWQQNKLYANGMTLYAATLQENPSSWLLHFNLANALDDEHRPAEAIQQYEEAISLKPDFVEAHYNLGNVLTHTGQPQSAIDQYQQVLQLKPYWAPQVHCALGFLFNSNGQPQKAVDEYQQAVNLKPNSAEYHYNLGNAFLALGRTSDAKAQYQKALNLKTDFADARDKLSNMAHRPANLSASIAHDEQLLQQNPNYAEVHYNLANALLKNGRVQESIVHYRRALEIKPDLVEAANGLGAALLLTAQPEEATKYLEQALLAKPDYLQALANLANAYSQTNRPDEALAVAQKALEMARSQGQTALAQQMEAWLASYRAKLSSGAGQSNAPGQTSALDQSAAPDAKGRQPIAPPPTSPGSNSNYPAP